MRERRQARVHVHAPLQVGQTLALEKPTSHHLITVLRASPGDTLVLFNGDGFDYTAELVDNAKRAQVHVVAAAANPADSPLHSTLIQGISRGDKMDLTIQKCVELGLSRLSPVYTRRSIARLDDKRRARKLEHWQSIALSACEQCGRSTVPVIDEPVPLADCLARVDRANSARAAYVLSPGAGRALLRACADHLPTEHAPLPDEAPAAVHAVSLLVGPESGLDDDEIELATRHGFEAVRLGPRVLRTETAGLTALTLLQAWLGDLNAVTSD